MSRAIRRQQTAAPKERPGRQRLTGGGGRQPTRGAQPPVRQRRRLRIGKPQWLDDIISELKKVTWPTRNETVYLTSVVILVALAVGIMLGAVDIFFNWLIDKLLLQ
jgi:preprotein translocase subunit SecE